MEITLALTTVPDLHAALAEAERGSLLARLRAGGTHCVLRDVAPERAAARLAAALAEDEGNGALPLRLDLGELDGLPQQGASCLLLIDGAERCPPEVLLIGARLPAHGDLGSAELEDLLTTLRALRGHEPGRGRNLLEVQGEAWDTNLDRQLTERLRQLYGE